MMLISKIKKCVKSSLKICPFYQSANKILKFTSVNKELLEIEKLSLEEEMKVKNILDKIHIGKNIALFGVFCPTLWFALLSGKRGRLLKLGFFTSGLSVSLGLIQVGYYKEQLKKLIS